PPGRAAPAREALRAAPSPTRCRPRSAPKPPVPGRARTGRESPPARRTPPPWRCRRPGEAPAAARGRRGRGNDASPRLLVSREGALRPLGARACRRKARQGTHGRIGNRQPRMRGEHGATAIAAVTGDSAEEVRLRLGIEGGGGLVKEPEPDGACQEAGERK